MGYSCTSLHLVFGSPGGLPTLSRVQTALQGLESELEDLRPIVRGREGVVVLAGRDATSVVHVKVYGRDACDGEFVADAWRRVWYPAATIVDSVGVAVEHVEHEGFMMFLAERVGRDGAGGRWRRRVDNGDALIALRPIAAPLADGERPALYVSQVRSAWDELGTLHAVQIAHQRVDLDRVGVLDDSRVAFTELSSASVQCDVDDVLKDRAQLFALTLVRADQDDAIGQAWLVLGDDGLGVVLPYLQRGSDAAVDVCAFAKHMWVSTTYALFRAPGRARA